jgi:hypothetical protein
MVQKSKVVVRYGDASSFFPVPFMVGSENNRSGWAVIPGRVKANGVEMTLNTENVRVNSGGHQAAIVEALSKLDAAFEEFGYSRLTEPQLRPEETD